VSVADEVGGVASAVYWTNKGATAVVKGGHRKMQEYGMRYQNWRHKGAGETDDDALPIPSNGPRMAGQEMAARDRPRGKNWTTDEESFENTTTSHTTYTRKRTR
jgi:hypothetical protein